MNDDQISFAVYTKPTPPVRGDWYLFFEYDNQAEALKAAKGLGQSYRIVKQTKRVVAQHSYDHPAHAT